MCMTKGLLKVLMTLLCLHNAISVSTSLHQRSRHVDKAVYLSQVNDLRAFASEQSAAADAAEAADDVHMVLVETLPVGDFNLSSASTTMSTFDALFSHINAAKESIDLSAMYWNLLGKDDRKVFSDAEMAAFGAERGQQLFLALKQAAARGVLLRILTSKQQLQQPGDFMEPMLPEEIEEIRKDHPDKVQVREWSGAEWYGGGILHHKLWVFDRQHLYLGSANMDWKSLAQVMEVGVLMENASSHECDLLAELQRLFDLWWLWASLPVSTSDYFSTSFQSVLRVPNWSRFLAPDKRHEDPFVAAQLQAKCNYRVQCECQLQQSPKGQGTARSFFASAPMETTVSGSRTFDLHSLEYTIASARQFVKLNVMDFVPFSMYPLATHPRGSIWFPALQDALLAKLFATPGIQIQLLISQWAHTRPEMLQALKALEQQGKLCRTLHSAKCTGTLEIRLFLVPGWNHTHAHHGSTQDDAENHQKTKSHWPSYTRVNHGKYIVTDQRLNIGCSNMEWGYFYTTAGASFNSDADSLRTQLMALFDRNWDSDYASSLSSSEV